MNETRNLTSRIFETTRQIKNTIRKEERIRVAMTTEEEKKSVGNEAEDVGCVAKHQPAALEATCVEMGEDEAAKVMGGFGVNCAALPRTIGSFGINLWRYFGINGDL